MDLKLNHTTISLQQGDLTALPVDAVVYYAREDLQLGSGFGTAIQSRGGDAIKKELARIGRIGMGEAVVTTAGNLAARHLIHACGPKFHEPGTEKKLRACVRSALETAARNELKSIAFSPMGAGFYGVPLDLCATVMLEVMRNYLERSTPLEQVIICVRDSREFAAFRDRLEPHA